MDLDGLKDRLIAAIAARRQARGETNYEALAGEVGRTAERVRQWATGEDLPPLGILPKVCEALDVTAEHLLFGTGSPDVAAKTSRQVLAENVRILAEMRFGERFQGDLVRAGISNGNVTRVLQGHTSIGLDVLEHLANVLGVPASRLLAPIVNSDDVGGDAASGIRTPVNETLGGRIKARRIELGLSQTKVAKLAGISQATLCELEKGRSRGTANLVKLANALSVTPEWLDAGDGRPITTPPAMPAHLLKIAEKLAVVHEDKLKAVATLLGIKL